LAAKARLAHTDKENAMTTNTDWNELAERHEMAYFKADICLGSPQSYTLEEKKAIREEMDASTKAVDAALKRDFESLPPEAQDMLIDMLYGSGCMTPEYWKETLIGAIPETVASLDA